MLEHERNWCQNMGCMCVWGGGMCVWGGGWLGMCVCFKMMKTYVNVVWHISSLSPTLQLQ